MVSALAKSVSIATPAAATQVTAQAAHTASAVGQAVSPQHVRHLYRLHFPDARQV
jgi:hypothetical protein